MGSEQPGLGATLLGWPKSIYDYVHEHDRLGFEMLTVETAVFDCICRFSSSRDRKGQSYPVEYYLESAEEYSEGKIHKSDPEPERKCKYCVLC